MVPSSFENATGVPWVLGGRAPVFGVARIQPLTHGTPLLVRVAGRRFLLLILCGCRAVLSLLLHVHVRLSHGLETDIGFAFRLVDDDFRLGALVLHDGLAGALHVHLRLSIGLALDKNLRLSRFNLNLGLLRPRDLNLWLRLRHLNLGAAPLRR